jgi:outer membrane protein W
MQRALQFFYLLMIIPVMDLSAQDADTGRTRKFSFSVGYAPITTFYFPGVKDNTKFNNSYNGITEIIYQSGFNLRADYRINEKLLLNSGVNYKERKSDYSVSSFGLFAYTEESKNNKFIYELPLSLNYSFLKSPGLLEPYVSAGLRLSIFKWDHVGSYTKYISGTIESGIIDDHKTNTFMFVELGTGTYINISNSFSFLIEANVTSTKSFYGYFELFSGLRYSF